MSHKHLLLILPAAAVLILAAALSVTVQPAHAGAQPQAANETCLACHANPGQAVPLPNGDQLSISIDTGLYKSSAHGAKEMACTACHYDIAGFPHPELDIQSLRDYTYQKADTCKTCHAEKYDAVKGSVHENALQGGNRNAPVCADCHNPHTQSKITGADGIPLASEKVNVPMVCARCHNAIFEQYKESVHGEGVLNEQNPDVPTCIDCHGVHSITDPTTNAFRLASPQLCADCHTDSAVMDKYGLSTKVLDTYVADFHGTTVTLFEKQSPDQETNKPVCFDCHGVHDIRAVADPQKGIQVRENMLKTCQKCHPGANLNFPDSWLSHYIPSREKYPLVYYVNLFYTIFIPTVLGGMAVFVVSDIFRKLVDKRKAAAPRKGGKTS